MTDREKIIRAIEKAKKQSKEYAIGEIIVPFKEADMIIALLKEQEAKTGKWIEQTDYMGDTYYDCSVCNESWITIEGTPWLNGMNYCPHCGAKMEGR